ncbi:MAG: 4'-phosphopantetheinyl transferase superfamily protein [Candidatus Margulisiibacteriota bacterium]
MVKELTVDIWQVNLDQDEQTLKELESLLSEEELARAHRLKIEDVKRRFVASRGMLRRILARYTGGKSEDLKFQYNSNGKPELIQSKVCFNLSHSGDVALYAVTLDRAVGVDIEKVKENINYKELAKRYFSEQEFNSIMSHPESQQKEKFYRCWTRKEAYLKAKGSSIAQLLDKNVDTSNWFVADLDSIGSSYIAAVAVEGESADVRYHKSF